MLPRPTNASVADRFLSNTASCPPCDCLIWLGAPTNKQGYGRFLYEGKTPEPAHRSSYRLFVGEIPEGLWVLHTCDNRLCVNPRHLYAGTRRQNVDDMVKRGRSYKPSGSRNPKSKLNESLIPEIKRMLSLGWSCAATAKRFGVSKATISSINVGRYWAGVHDETMHALEVYS